jgi:hypothetical protein
MALLMEHMALLMEYMALLTFHGVAQDDEDFFWG